MCSGFRQAAITAGSILDETIPVSNDRSNSESASSGDSPQFCNWAIRCCAETWYWCSPSTASDTASLKRSEPNLVCRRAITISELNARLSHTNNVTTWNPDSDSWVYALALSGSTVYAGGFFDAIGGQSRNGLAALSATGGAIGWNPNPDIGDVQSLAMSGSTVYVGGQFNTIGGQSRNNLAAISSTGGAIGWNPNVSAGGTVNALIVTTSTVYAGGQFSTVGGLTRNSLAAINSAGTVTSWNPNASPINSTVSALALGGTTLYVGGNFTGIGAGAQASFAEFFVAPFSDISSWNPTLLVNTEAFQVIDAGDANTNIQLKFGNALNAVLTYDITNTAFVFTQSVLVQGTLTVTGAIKLTTITTSGSVLYSSGTTILPNAKGASGQVLVSQGTSAPQLKDSIGAMIWYIDGTLATGMNQCAQVTMPFGVTAISVSMNIKGKPTGAPLIADIRTGNTSLFSTKPQINAGSTTGGTGAVLSTTQLTRNSVISLDITQVGSTFAGSGLTVLLNGIKHY
jgi:hypothetical protein